MTLSDHDTRIDRFGKVMNARLNVTQQLETEFFVMGLNL